MKPSKGPPSKQKPKELFSWPMPCQDIYLEVEKIKFKVMSSMFGKIGSEVMGRPQLPEQQAWELESALHGLSRDALLAFWRPFAKKESIIRLNMLKKNSIFFNQHTPSQSHHSQMLPSCMAIANLLA